MTSILFLGLLIGMQHALEADHVAAVGTFLTRRRSARGIIAHGLAWGLGHAITLSLFAGGAIVLGVAIGERLAGWLEVGVALLLIGLGGHLLYRLIRDRVHFHRHRHDDGTSHFHAHSHAGEGRDHTRSAHHHGHPAGLPVRALTVGLMQGMAGSAALVVLTAAGVRDPLMGLLFVAVFAAGSITGMVVLSALIAVPLAYLARTLTWAQRGLEGAVGLITMALGGWLLSESPMLAAVLS